ncbi:hypothetical protein ACFXGT_32375 [Streptomyces sp. NPDC059352]|uniref:hypothetical protein n=1 Tax=Streptomyces sp. NPDC059352 TaxID=3346810 RepID=UPI0036BDBDBA
MAIPIVCAYGVIKKVSESPRWKHATRASIAAVLAAPASLFMWLAISDWQDKWDTMTAMENAPLVLDDDGVNYDAPPPYPDWMDRDEALADQQAELTSASNSANGSMLIGIPLIAWAAAEWVVAIRRVRDRDASLGSLRYRCEETRAMVTADRPHWDAVRDDYLMTARACAVNPDPGMPAAVRAVKDRFRAAAEHRMTLMEDAHTARATERETAQVGRHAMNDVETQWRNVCESLADVEEVFTCIEEQVHTHAAAMYSYPALFTRAELDAMRDEANAVERQVWQAREMVRQADVMRQQWM